MPNLPAYNWKAIFSDGVQTTRTNLITNPSIEFTAAGYENTSPAGSTLVRTTTEAFVGSASLAASTTATGGNLIFGTSTITRLTVNPSTSYHALAYVKSATIARTARIRILFYNGAGVVVQTSNGTDSTTSTSAWQPRTVVATSPATAATAIVQLVVLGVGTTETHYGDAFLFEQATTSRAYFDGATFLPLTPPEYVNSVAWTGVGHSSTSIETIQNWYQLPDIQTIDIFRGRRLQIDDYSIDNATITSLDPTGWTNTPRLGDDIQIYVDAPGYVAGTDTFPAFWGSIRNVDIQYGKVPAEDQVTISCEGLQAEWGRAALNAFSLPQQLTDESILDVGTEVGLPTAQFGGRSTNSAITFTGNAFDLVNGITRTEEARMWAYGQPLGYRPELWWFGRNLDNASTHEFNDGTITPSIIAQLYEQIEFRSSADNYYNEVTISPDAVAAQTATLGVTPIFGWDKDTYDFSTSQALDHAQWVLQNFQNKNQAIASITFTDIQQSATYGPGVPNGVLLTVIKVPIATKFAIVFRGTKYYTIGEGVQISARPGQTRFTLFVSGQDQNAYLKLDDTIFGTLDFNKLGF